MNGATVLVLAFAGAAAASDWPQFRGVSRDGRSSETGLIRTCFDDYRSVGGALLPFWVYVEEMFFSHEYVFESIEANVPIDDALFEPAPDAARSDR